MAQAFALASGEQARAVVALRLETASAFASPSSDLLSKPQSLLSHSRAAGLDQALRALHQLAPAGTPAP